MSLFRESFLTGQSVGRHFAGEAFSTHVFSFDWLDDMCGVAATEELGLLDRRVLHGIFVSAWHYASYKGANGFSQSCEEPFQYASGQLFGRQGLAIGIPPEREEFVSKLLTGLGGVLISSRKLGRIDGLILKMAYF